MLGRSDVLGHSIKNSINSHSPSTHYYEQCSFKVTFIRNRTGTVPNRTGPVSFCMQKVRCGSKTVPKPNRTGSASVCMEPYQWNRSRCLRHGNRLEPFRYPSKTAPANQQDSPVRFSERIHLGPGPSKHIALKAYCTTVQPESF